MFSSLCSEIVLADESNYTKGRNYKNKNYKICKITPHHMAVKWTGRRCAESFQNPSRGASANYCIGYEGEIVGCVDEDNRAWTSGSRENDYQAITIECSNDTTGGNWHISDATIESLIKLCVDICSRYNFLMYYDETPNGSLTRHNMFQATSCPGEYLQSKFYEIAKRVNEILTGKIKYKAHIQDKGWTEWVYEGQVVGTTGESKRVEAIIIDGIDEIDLEYRVHMEGIGWGSWVNKGEIAGTTGESRRIEAIEIKSNKILEVQEHIQEIGWLPASVGTDVKVGTEGKSLRLEAFKISVR